MRMELRSEWVCTDYWVGEYGASAGAVDFLRLLVCG